MKPKALATAVAFALGLVALPALAGPIIVELFTSQGCPECPPANEMMAEFAGREGLIALTMPVDIWDPFGWKDTLATPENTARQQGYYMAPGGAGYAYTPHVVVNGAFQVPGNDRAAIDNALAAAALAPSVDVAVTRTGSGVRIDVAAAAAGGPSWGTVWVVMYREAETVAVGAGENAGRTLNYTNVVVKMHRLTVWRGEATTFELPMAELTDVNADGCVVIIQQERDGLPGAIIGAIEYSVRAW